MRRQERIARRTDVQGSRDPHIFWLTDGTDTVLALPITTRSYCRGTSHRSKERTLPVIQTQLPATATSPNNSHSQFSHALTHKGNVSQPLYAVVLQDGATVAPVDVPGDGPKDGVRPHSHAARVDGEASDPSATKAIGLAECDGGWCPPHIRKSFIGKYCHDACHGNVGVRGR